MRTIGIALFVRSIVCLDTYRLCYRFLTRSFIPVCRCGLFKDAAPIPRDLLAKLDERAPGIRLEVIGVDPGHKKIVAHSRAVLTSGTRFSDFRGCAGKGPSHTTAQDWKYQSLRKAAQGFEVRRRASSAAYRLANEALMLTTARGGLVELQHHADVVMQHLASNCDEKLSAERRRENFARVRAHDRALAKMAGDIVGKSPDHASKQSHDRNARTARDATVTAIRLQAVEQLKLRRAVEGAMRGLPPSEDTRERVWSRVVFFGAAQFGHGSRGPLPRKALLRVLARMCAVVMTDEHRTSKCCGGCGEDLIAVDRSRVFRCPSHRDEPGSCSVNYIDRDVNGCGNIGLVGARQLLGLDRPEFLTRRDRRTGAE